MLDDFITSDDTVCIIIYIGDLITARIFLLYATSQPIIRILICPQIQVFILLIRWRENIAQTPKAIVNKISIRKNIACMY